MSTESSAYGRAYKTRSTFSQSTGVRVNIRSTPERVWALVTDATRFPQWNSTVKSIKGTIAPGQKIKVVVTAAPERVFNLTVSEFVPAQKMVWRDGMTPMFTGVRTHTLTPQTNGTTDFEMVEVLSGLMLPMIKGSLPDFGPDFIKYGSDLKRASEAQN